MKLLRVLGFLVTLGGLGALVVGPSVHGQSVIHPVGVPDDPRRELTILSGRGAEIGVRIAEGVGGGVKIEEVQPGSPAEKAGLKRDDLIVEFDGERVRGSRQFARLVQETPPGRSVKAKLMRDGHSQDVQITPGEGHGVSDLIIDGHRLGGFFGDLKDRREYGRPFDFNFDLDLPGVLSGGRLGVSVNELTSQLAEYFGVKDGVVVTSVTDGSAAARAGVKAGDVITSINGQRVASREDLLRGLREALREKGAESSDQVDVKLGIVRDKKEVLITAKVEPMRRTLRRGRPA